MVAGAEYWQKTVAITVTGNLSWLAKIDPIDTERLLISTEPIENEGVLEDSDLYGSRASFNKLQAVSPLVLAEIGPFISTLDFAHRREAATPAMP